MYFRLLRGSSIEATCRWGMIGFSCLGEGLLRSKSWIYVPTVVSARHLICAQGDLHPRGANVGQTRLNRVAIELLRHCSQVGITSSGYVKCLYYSL